MRIRTVALVALVVTCAAALPAAAQAPGSAPAQRGPIVERVQNSVFFAPDVKFGQINGHDSTFVGGTAGVRVEDRLFLGGGGYWLANSAPDREVWYVGFVGGWYFAPMGPLDVSLTALLGGGRATLGYTLDRPVGRGGSTGPGGRHANSSHYGPYPVYAWADFLIAEPTATATLRITRTVAVFGSVGYRWIGQAGPMNSDLSGVSGAVGIRFGR
jgi:hypothetical protein